MARIQDVLEIGSITFSSMAWHRKILLWPCMPSAMLHQCSECGPARAHFLSFVLSVDSKWRLLTHTTEVVDLLHKSTLCLDVAWWCTVGTALMRVHHPWMQGAWDRVAGLPLSALLCAASRGFPLAAFPLGPTLLPAFFLGPPSFLRLALLQPLLAALLRVQHTRTRMLVP